MNKTAWYVIINPRAGHGRAGKLWPAFQEEMQKEGFCLEAARTQKQGDGERLAREAVAKGYSKIIAVGGDGTVNEVLNGFFSGSQCAPVELAIFPMGTGGDFVRSSKSPRAFPDFLEVLKREEKRWVDVGLVEFQDADGYPQRRYFLNVADAGLGGETVAKVNLQSKRLGGRLSFLLGSVKAILRYRNKWMKCVLDGHELFSETVNSIIVANGSFFGGGMKIAPGAKLDDGLFNIVVLGNFNKLQLLWHLPKIYQGNHLQVRGVSVYQGTSVVLEGKGRILLDVDGEQPGVLPARFSVLAASLCLRV